MRHPYTPIRRGADDEDSSEKSSWPMTRRFHYDFHSMLRLLGIGFLIAVVATVGISLLSWHPWHSSDPAPSSAHCGNSSAEAAAMGCSFDIMSFTWSRKACFDEELMHEFLAARNWTWWLASDGNQEVAMETVALGIHPRLFVSWEYHLFHYSNRNLITGFESCAFYQDTSGVGLDLVTPSYVAQVLVTPKSRIRDFQEPCVLALG
ncbi:hypothetical protein TruAng_005955 [Truncatella angustata]|nr:hypothetical protein TruAng_005955 [Truncatella angustata]